MRLHSLLLTFLISFQAQAIIIPDNLSEADAQDVINILGIGTSSKLLSNPYPLGGHSGVEFGLSVEVLDVAELSRLGNTSTEEAELRYNKLTIGKGLYNNVDLFFQFVPFASNDDINLYGGILKWAFFEAETLPLTISTLFTGSVFSANDEFRSETFGVELMSGISVKNFSLYFGGGQIHSEGEFMPSKVQSGLTLTPSSTYKDKNENVHTFVGVSAHWGKTFASVQIDRYSQAVFSAKLGLRL